jgi:hypothetical protein
MPPILSFHEEREQFPDIVHGIIVFYKGKKYLCGRAKAFDWEGPGFKRYIMALEMDWQFWEPPMTADAWEDWDEVYDDICKGAE